MNKTSAERTWAIVGKISVLLTILGTLVYIGATVKVSGPRLVATCSFADYALPPDLVAALAANRQAQGLGRMSSILQDATRSDPTSSLDAFDLARIVADSLESTWPDAFRYRLDLYHGFLQVIVHNGGNRPALDVVLDIPAKGIAVLTPESGPQQILSCDGSISLGAIRPGSSLSIGLWSSIYGPALLRHDTRLTHTAGVGKVQYERAFSGWRAWVARNAVLLVYFVLIVAILPVSLRSLRARSPLEEAASGSDQDPSSDA